MAYSTRINVLPNDLRNLFRRLERVKEKVVNAEWSLFFNKTCLKEHLWPNYTSLRSVAETHLKFLQAYFIKSM